MKLKSILIPSLLALGVAALVRGQEVKFPGKTDAPAPADAAPAAATQPAAAPAAAPAPTFTDTQVLETIGWFIGKNSQADTFQFTKEQMDPVLRGFALALAGKDSPNELKQIGPQVEAFVRAKQEAYMSKLRQKGLAESALYLTEIKKQPGVIALPSGLCYLIIKPGEGPAPKLTDTIKADYVGALVNGTVFDSSLQRGKPVVFPLDQVIPGWSEGLQKIAKGGKIRLYVPPQLAYGDEGRAGIPPASTLVFDIEILDITPTPPAPATPAPAAK